MDRIDAEIIDLLQRDGRRTQADIASRVKLSQPSIADRIKKLEERGYITGYVATVDPARLGYDITALVGVGIAHPRFFPGFEAKILELPEVQEAHRVAGRDSYVLKIRAANTRALDELLVGTIRLIQGVTRTHTTIVLSSTKEGTFLSAKNRAHEEDST